MSGIPERSGVPRCVRSIQSIRSDRRVVAGSWPASRSDVEAEHHAALVMLGDVAVGHPTARVRDVEQDVDRLTGADEHGVLPGQVRFHDVVAREDHEPAGPVDVERVWHGVVGVHLVDEA